MLETSVTLEERGVMAKGQPRWGWYLRKRWKPVCIAEGHWAPRDGEEETDSNLLICLQRKFRKLTHLEFEFSNNRTLSKWLNSDTLLTPETWKRYTEKTHASFHSSSVDGISIVITSKTVIIDLPHIPVLMARKWTTVWVCHRSRRRERCQVHIFHSEKSKKGEEK